MVRLTQIAGLPLFLTLLQPTAAIAGGVLAAHATLEHGVYHLDWSTVQPGAPVAVYTSGDPDGVALRSGRRLAISAPGAAMEVPAAGLAPRPFFLVATTQDDPGLVTATRIVPLQGQSNFRDLGGYAASDGRHVRWGAIYRSGELSGLTAADYGLLASLHIRTVCDLRDVDEQGHAPTAWKAGAVAATRRTRPGKARARSPSCSRRT